MSSPQPKISTRTIRAFLSTAVALGHLAKETADMVAKGLQLDDIERQYKERPWIDLCVDELHDLLEEFGATIDFNYLGYGGTPRSGIFLTNEKGEYQIFRFDGERLDARLLSLIPKVMERKRMIADVEFSTAMRIEVAEAILKAAYAVDRASMQYVTDKKFKEMITPYLKSKKK